MSVIYQFKNKVSKKVFIGICADDSSKKRVLTQLEKNKFTNRCLQADFNIYGKEAFEYSVLEEFEYSYDRTKANELKQKWMDRLQAYNPEFGYNLCPTAGNSLGYKHTAECIEKMSEMILGEKHHGYGKHRDKETKVKMSEARKLWWLKRKAMKGGASIC